MVPAKGLHPGSFGHIPHPDALVLRVGQDELLPWVEDGAGHIVVVAAACVQLPCLGFCKVITTMTSNIFFDYSMQGQVFDILAKQKCSRDTGKPDHTQRSSSW